MLRTITGGSGNATIAGLPGDKIWAGKGDNSDIYGNGGTGNYFIDASSGFQTVTGRGDGTNGTIWGGLGDQILGGAGNVTIGGGGGDTIIGGSGDCFIDASLGNQYIEAGPVLVSHTFGFPRIGNATIWGGAGDTIVGGAGSIPRNETIGGAAGDTITGGVGNVGRTLVGALFVSIVRIGMTFLGVNIFAQQIVFGVMLILAVAVTIDRSKIAIVK